MNALNKYAATKRILKEKLAQENFGPMPTKKPVVTAGSQLVARVNKLAAKPIGGLPDSRLKGKKLDALMNRRTAMPMQSKMQPRQVAQITQKMSLPKPALSSTMKPGQVSMNLNDAQYRKQFGKPHPGMGAFEKRRWGDENKAGPQMGRPQMGRPTGPRQSKSKMPQRMKPMPMGLPKQLMPPAMGAQSSSPTGISPNTGIPKMGCVESLNKYAAKQKLVCELEKVAVWGAIAKGLGAGARMATKAAVRLGNKGPSNYGKFVGSVKATPVAASSVRGKASGAMFGLARGARKFQEGAASPGSGFRLGATKALSQGTGLGMIGGGALYAKKQQRAREAEAMANRPLSSRMGTAQVSRIMAKPKPRQTVNIPAGKPIIGRRPQPAVTPSRWSVPYR